MPGYRVKWHDVGVEEGLITAFEVHSVPFHAESEEWNTTTYIAERALPETALALVQQGLNLEKHFNFLDRLSLRELDLFLRTRRVEGD